MCGACVFDEQIKGSVWYLKDGWRLTGARLALFGEIGEEGGVVLGGEALHHFSS